MLLAVQIHHAAADEFHTARLVGDIRELAGAELGRGNRGGRVATPRSVEYESVVMHLDYEIVVR